MAEDVIVQWEQPQIFGMDRSTTWHGSVIAPVKTIQYAVVACSIHGQWYGCIWPKGRMSKGIELYAILDDRARPYYEHKLATIRNRPKTDQAENKTDHPRPIKEKAT